MNRTLRLAEYVLPGHPDKLCDRIADGIVDRASSLSATADSLPCSHDLLMSRSR